MVFFCNFERNSHISSIFAARYVPGVSLCRPASYYKQIIDVSSSVNVLVRRVFFPFEGVSGFASETPCASKVMSVKKKHKMLRIYFWNIQ